jgi:hypothetical protein
MTETGGNMDEGEVRAEFAKRKTRQILAVAPLVAAFVAARWCREHAAELVLGIPGCQWFYVACAAAAAGIVFSMLNWRCPACKGYLGRRISPDFCSHCGAALQ